MDITEPDLRSDVAEMALIGALAFHPDAMASVLASLPGNRFYSPHRENVWNVCRALSVELTPIDPITVSRRLTDLGEWNPASKRVVQVEMSSPSPAAHAVAHAATLTDLHRRRELVRALTRANQQVAEHTGDSSEVLAAVRRQFDGLDQDETAERKSTTLTWSQLVDEFETAHAPGGSSQGIPSPWYQLDELLGGLHKGRMYTFGGRPGSGKALALDTPIPTPTGWIAMGDIRPGDVVFDAGGKPTAVTAAWDVRHNRTCYEIEFSDGSILVADAEHQWLTETRASRKSSEYQRQRVATRGSSPFSRDQRHKTVKPGVVTTAEIAATVRVNADQRVNHSIRTCEPLDLPRAVLPIPPYTLGVWLGDGTSRSSEYTSADPEIAAYIESDGFKVERLTTYLRYAIKLPERAIPKRKCAACDKSFTPRNFTSRACSRSCGYSIRGKAIPIPGTCHVCGGPTTGFRGCQGCWAQGGTVVAQLRSLGVLGNKHIPTAYLRADVAQRRELLAGLLDTDGTVSGGGQAVFSVTSERLARDFYELAVSLGYRVSWTSKRVRGRSEASSTAYAVGFSTPDDVFRLERKRLLHKERRASSSEARSRLRYVVDVRPVPSVPVRCISVDNPDHLYLAGRSMIPTHNSTAALVIAEHAATESGKQVLIFSKEMPTVDVMGRILAWGGQVNVSSISHRRLSDYEMDSIRAYLRKVGQPGLRVNASPVSLEGIKTIARAQHHRIGLDILVVDYLQLVKSDSVGRSREQEVGKVSSELKALAMELGIVVVLPAQLNRGPASRSDARPMMSDLRDSGQIEQDSDAVILLWHQLNEKGEPTGNVTFIVDKNRHGPRGELDLRWHGGYGGIGDRGR